ncbi:2-polyprenyl-6-hydroxyphenyl methylase / 3-demethylubiquinone-9 3-methyltransferase [Singulisphaera sp. GP187]|uniref:class I SAM-dependent methyltransferase n=1 Tax=Singulisphaera sp. GP187 TaxID=1882752 RepID=UPI000926D829|nr:class I SAM-dependent methyltransferase [Singulisphaera sp. GP187]SIO59813.1 2-polyprenyl-6-hydroxyphenyl methylase / 3-demethylubiquinone-9 3-methyltransferase [Singulisphaera sp. GP187]
MTACHEAEVAAQFDRQQQRFKSTVAVDDVRLSALKQRLEPLRGRRVLDLGCGKGRFARPLAEAGAELVGIDLSAAMLADARGIARVRGSARRLPFAADSFDAVIAVEVFEHLAAIDDVLREARRVLRPGGVLAIVDKNAGALNADRPWLPSLVVKRIDELRGLWMYSHDSPVRERWFWPGRFRNHLGRWFDEVHVDHILSPKEADRRLFRQIPRARLLTLWTARVAGSLV